MREDGLIEHKGHLINPHIIVGGFVGAVVWSKDKIDISGPQNINRISAQILQDWKQNGK